MATRGNFLGTSTDDQALALTLYSGMFTAAPRSGIFLFDTSLPFVARKTVTAGKAHQFLMDGDVPEAEDFEPGDEMLGQVVAVDQGTITVDKYLVEHTFIGKDQLAISHVEYIDRIARKHKSGLERKLDKRLFSIAVQAARNGNSTATGAPATSTAVTKNGLTIHNGGNRVTRTGGTTTSGAAVVSTPYSLDATGAANVRSDAQALSMAMDLDFLSSDRWFIPTVRTKHVLMRDTTNQVFSRDFTNANNQMEQNITLIDGFKFAGAAATTSQMGPMPDQNITDTISKYSVNALPSTYTGAPQLLAFANTSDGAAAVGLVTYDEIQHVVVYQPQKLGWLFLSYTLVGAGVMNPWCVGAVEIIT